MAASRGGALEATDGAEERELSRGADGPPDRADPFHEKTYSAPTCREHSELASLELLAILGRGLGDS